MALKEQYGGAPGWSGPEDSRLRRPRPWSGRKES
ncbi:MAG: hypothetical protein V8S34_00805 [Lawsonibacter sp.]